LIEWITEKTSGLTFPVPIGSMIPAENQYFVVGERMYSPAKDEQSASNFDILDYAKTFLNTPYRWGGKSPMGIDCSGFAQVIFSLKQVGLPRDAYQQAECGELVSFIDQAQPGDLAFFDNPEGRITHVGIILSNAPGEFEIIHASGKVKIDRLDHAGIFDTQTGVYTHNLRLIRRVTDSVNFQ
jgi:cell wall-associated NlpC family hydrolase